MKIHTRRIVLAGMLSMLLTACASFQAKPEDVVTQRINARWQALIKGEMEAAYGFSAPGYRAAIDLTTFKGRTGIAGRWLGVQVVRVECDQPTRCKAVVRLEYSTLIPGFSKTTMNTHIDETWLLEDGRWWIFQQI